MFTGIIQEVGTVASRRQAGGVMRLAIHAPLLAAKVGPPESVAVNGACLSIVERRQGRLTFEMIPETQRLTTLGSLRAGDGVNLEPSLSLSDRLNGHVVLGHVDGVGAVARRTQRPGELSLTIRAPAGVRPYLVPQGPITVNGVSLTIGRQPSASTFTVHLIPETLRQTTLRALSVGDRVNLEVDYLAKLVAHVILRPAGVSRSDAARPLPASIRKG